MAKKVSPDKLQQRTLRILQGVIQAAENNPSAVLSEKGMVKSIIDVAEHLRKLNADLNSTLDLRALQKMDDAAFEELERKAKGEE